MNKLVEAMQKYDHICPEVDLVRCPLCEARWEHEKQQLKKQKKRIRRQKYKNKYYC